LFAVYEEIHKIPLWSYVILLVEIVMIKLLVGFPPHLPKSVDFHLENYDL
jgi:hypothetical protein